MTQPMQATLLRVDRTLLEEAKRAFLPRIIDPDISHEQIMYDAGAQAVLRWLDMKLPVAKSSIGGATREEVGATPDSRLARLLT